MGESVKKYAISALVVIVVVYLVFHVTSIRTAVTGFTFSGTK